jgi:hypothetical protein
MKEEAAYLYHDIRSEGESKSSKPGSDLGTKREPCIYKATPSVTAPDSNIKLLVSLFVYRRFFNYVACIASSFNVVNWEGHEGKQSSSLF